MKVQRSYSILAFIVTISLLLSTSASFAVPASADAPIELFFSEYIEGSSNNRALEIYNGTGSTINLANGSYDVQVFFNGSALPGLTMPLTGSVDDDDVFVLAHASADPIILAQADQTSSTSWYNGDDAVVLRKNGIMIDVIGQTGFDPGTEWGTGVTSTFDNTLRRKSSVCQGDPIGTDTFDPSLEWDGYTTNTFDGLGAHTTRCSAKLVFLPVVEK
jgi:predicted extracellular nuclease